MTRILDSDILWHEVYLLLYSKGNIERVTNTKEKRSSNLASNSYQRRTALLNYVIELCNTIIFTA